MAKVPPPPVETDCSGAFMSTTVPGGIELPSSSGLILPTLSESAKIEIASVPEDGVGSFGSGGGGGGSLSPPLAVAPDLASVLLIPVGASLLRIVNL